ncbi:hypothetical protein SAMN05421890_4804 [Ensifer adhaerens]|nr:hypothetical protein SAMN05421890_4804 [Ensifer adhaerens]HZG27656.1 hypothetical protein [Ensifer sp.]
MAQVISIRERLPRNPRRADPAATDAQILLFTGVRYERFGQIPERVELDDRGEPVKH